MKNIKVSITDDAYAQARLWADQRDTSLSSVIEFLLVTLPKLPRAQRSIPARKQPAPAQISKPA